MPFVVLLAAEAVAEEEAGALPNITRSSDAADPVEALLRHICVRERIRLKLPLTEQQQVDVLEALAVEFGDVFSMEEVQLLLSDKGLGPSGIEQEKITAHALLAFAGGRGRFRYDFLSEYLPARVLARWLLNGEAQDLSRVALKNCARTHDHIVDRCAQFLIRRDPQAIAQALSTRWRALPRESEERMGLSLILLRVAREMAPDGVGRASFVSRVVGDGWNDLRVRGPIRGLSFAGIRLQRCLFANAEFVNCRFDDSTAFDSCEFDGNLAFDRCEGFGAVLGLDTCRLSPRAKAAVQSESEDKHRFAITPDDVRKALYETLSLFYRADRFSPVNVSAIERHIRQYTFGRKLLRSLTVEGVLRKGGLGLSGNEERLEVAHGRSVREFLHNGVTFGPVGRALDSLLLKAS